MMKTKIFKTTKALLISLAVLLAAGCSGEVGLGDAVDTAAPTVELSYPPKNVIIRDTFVASGTCNDDLIVASVKVTVTNTSTKTVYGPYDATLNLDRTEWTVELNQKNGGKKTAVDYDAYNAYKQWEFPDGSYIVTAVAYDKKNNASPEASVPVAIDNTAPVLLVSKPLATGTEKASVYGRTINITGDVAEEHESSKLTLYYKEYDETTNEFIDEELKILEMKGFGTMSSDSPLTIAKYNKSLEAEADDVLHSNYLKIYGENIDLTQSNKKLYYCGFMLEDNAKLFQTPGDTGVEGGNKSEQYYILSDSYNEDLFSENTYSLNARNLMLLLSGKSSYTEEQISKITELLKQSGNSASCSDITATSSTKFSVDPKNNPVWSITNFEMWNDDFTTFEPGAAIPLVLEAGGDAISVDKNSLQIELYHLGFEPVEITAETPHATLIKKGAYADGLLKEVLSPQNEKTIKFYKDDDSENVESTGLSVNHYYEIIVSGSDVSGNELEAKKDYRYGFRRLSSFAPPSISFRSEEGAFALNEYQKGTKVNNDGILIKGTIVTADKDIYVQKENLEITAMTITDVSDSEITVEAVNTATLAEGTTSSAQVQYTYEIKDYEIKDNGDESKGKTYYFTAVIKKAADSNLIPQTQGAYKYKITFVAKDSLTAQNDGSDFEFKVDSKAPELSDSIVISPLVNKNDKSYVNGTISVTGNISDTGSGFKKLSYAIGNAAATQIENPGFHWTFDFDTTSLQDNKAYVLNIYAEDNVGNLLEIPCDITVDQSTDYPVISFSNSDTTFTKTANVLVGNITDDDGLDTIAIRYKMLSPHEDQDYTTYTPAAFTKGTTSYSLNVTLPQTEGQYEIEVKATDIKGLSTGSKTQTLTVNKDNGAPEFAIKTPNSTAQTYYSSAVTVNGTLKDGSGIVTIARDVYKVTGESQTIVPALCQESLASAITGTDAEIRTKIVNGCEWTDTFPQTQEGGTYKLVYTAKDKYDAKTVKELVFSMDIDEPSIESVLYGGKPVPDNAEESWFNKNYGEFLITTADATSSVVTVSYTKDDPEDPDAAWSNMSASEEADKWTSTITFEGSGRNKKLYLKAIDKAGNTSDVKEVLLNIDTGLPELTVSGLSGNVYVNKTENKTLTATYYDNENESGITPLQFVIGQTDITSKVSCVQKTDAEGSLTNEYDITIPKEEFVSGLFKVIGTDKAGNKNEVECCTFIVDLNPPVIKDIAITKSYKKSDSEFFIRNNTDGAIKISGIATDDNVFEKITLTISDGQQEPITLESTQSSWSFENINLSSWTKGSANVTLKAIDEIGNLAEKSFTIKFDEVNPNIITGECPDNRYTFRGSPVVKFNNLLLGQGRYSESTYGRLTSINVETYVDDKDSGLARLEYKLYTADNTLNLSEDNLRSYFTGTDLPAGITLASSGTFAPYPDQDYSYYNSNLDSNGNPIGTVSGKATKATASISGFNTTASEKVNYLLLCPTDNCGNTGSITILKIHVDQTAPVIETTSTEQLTNGSKAIDLSGSATDEDSGLKALRVIINGQSVLEINNESKDADGNLVTSVTNNYGTISYTSTYLLRDAPSSANWTVRLTPRRGAADDWFEPLGDNAEIYIEAEDWAEHDNKGNVAPNPTKAAVLKIDIKDPKLESINPANNTKLNGTNTISGTSSDEGSSPEEVSIYYSTAADMPAQLSGYTKLQTLSTIGENAVNVSELYNFTFDVNFDNLIAADKETQDIWILALVTDMAGNQSALSPVLYKIDRNTDRPVIKLVTEGINLSSMTSSAPIDLRENQVYINVTDDDGTVKKAEFRTKRANQTLADDEGWTEITLRNGSGKFTLDEDGIQTVEFRITDNNNSVFTSFAPNKWQRVYIEDADGHKLDQDPRIYTLLDVASPEIELQGIKLLADSDWTLPADFNKILGGHAGTQNEQKIQFKIHATDAGTGIETVKVVVKLNESAAATEYPATLTSGQNAEPYVYVAEVPTSSGDGVFDIEVVATDNAGRTNSVKKQLEIDNTAPAINVDSPDSTTEQSGVITAVGYTTEMVNLEYAVTASSDSPEDDKYTSYSSDLNYATSGFYVYFDGSSISGPNHTDELNSWLVNLGITTPEKLNSTDPSTWFETITTLYLHLKAQDSAGNIGRLAYPIKVDPQGNRPKVEFSYPSKDLDEVTLGGSINIIGSVTGKAQSYTVYMQIDTNNDGKWDNTDKTFLESKGYTLSAIPVLSNQYGIEIPVNGDVWSKKINESGEFEGTIKIRLYAVDNNGLISSAKVKTIKIDNDVPVIDQNIKLVQWKSGKDASNGITVTKTGANAGAYSFNTGAVKAMRNYTDGMSLSGKWYVVGKVTDDSGIAKINFDGTKDDGNSVTANTLAADGSMVISFTDSNNMTNYVFCFPVGSSTPNAVGKTQVLFYAKDGGEGDKAKSVEKVFNITYDNQAPEVTALGQNLEILNKDGFYTFESTAFEQTINGINQTGVERIAFYFTREIAGTDQATVIFDPMIRSGKDGNSQSYSSLTKEDDLYWKSATIAENGVAGTEITIAAGTNLTNVHKGGLAKINGVIYRIEGVNANTRKVTLSSAPESADSILFALANIIDNTIPEEISANAQKYTDDYGYGYPVESTGFDGDRMPEKCMKVGTKCTWSASINSKNISDGPVTLHYLVFDKAGNYTYLTSSAKVQNNSPRIAGAWIGTDENGSGTVEEGEFIKTYSGLFTHGYDESGKKATNVTIPANSSDENPISVLKIKRDLVIKPEIVGGNGKVGYTYKVGSDDSGTSPVELGTGTADDETRTVDLGTRAIKITVKDFLNNNITDGKNKKFSFTIWDSTPGLTYGTNSQSATLNVFMDVAVCDSTAATNKIIPFYWKSKEKNSLKDNSSEKGHIELSKDLAQVTGLSLNPKISGAVKLEGIAQDNSLLEELSVAISGYKNTNEANAGDPFTIASYSEGNWDEKSGTGWSTTIDEASYADYMAAGYITELPSGVTEESKVPYVSQDYGHVVHWTMEIDTEAMGLNPQIGLVITVAAKDKGLPALNGSGESATVRYTFNAFANNGDATVNQTGGDLGNNTNADGSSAKYTCKYTMDIVPYIRGIKTKLSTKSKKSDSSEYDRTALGHYPIAKDETIYLYGFNLSGGKLYDKAGNSATLGNAIKESDTPKPEVFTKYESYKGFTLYPVTGLTSFKSGEVYVKYGTGDSAVDSLNNKNWNNAQGSYGAAVPTAADAGLSATQTTFSNFYNRKPNSQNNYILTDDIELDVWNFNSEAAKPSKPGVISDPIMKINPYNNMIGFAYQSGPRVFSMAERENSYKEWLGDYDNLSATGFAYDSDGNTFGTALGGDINGACSIAKFAFMSSLWGQSGTGNDRNKNGDRHQRLEQIGQVGTKTDKSPAGNTSITDSEGNYIDKSRVLSPTIAVTGSGTNATVYMMYYDHMNQEIRFRWSTKPKSGSRGWNGKKGKINGVSNKTIGNYINDSYSNKTLGGNGSKENLHGESVPIDKYSVYQFQIIAESAAYTYNASGVGTETESTALGKPGSYLCIDAIPSGTTIKNAAGTNVTLTYDVVVLVWLDEENNNLLYTYNIVDLTAQDGKDYEGSEKTAEHWHSPVTIFTDAGQYCQVKVDKAGAVHIAAYDNNAGDVRYAKLPGYDMTSSNYSENTMSCVVDSNGIVGTNLTLDVAYDKTGNDGKAIPYISYYGSIGPKIAYLTHEGAGMAVSSSAGASSDMFTGYWEVSEIPSPSNVAKDRINVGLWKKDGVINWSTKDGEVPAVSNIGGTTHTGTGSTSSDGTTYGNGTKNPVVGYEIRPTSATGYIETAQMQ